VNVVAGAAIGAVMAPLVYLFATLLLTGPGRIPRTLVVLAALLAACIAAGVAIATSASITAGSTEMVTVVAYWLFAVGILTAGVVDVVERRIPNRITYPLLAFGVLGLPWLAFPITGWMLLGPLIGAVISGCIGMLNAVFADQGLGDEQTIEPAGQGALHAVRARARLERRGERKRSHELLR